MPDISMCANGRNCEARLGCFRWRAFPSEHGRQSFAYYSPDLGANCEGFFPTGDRRVRSLDDVDEQYDRERG